MRATGAGAVAPRRPRWCCPHARRHALQRAQRLVEASPGAAPGLRCEPAHAAAALCYRHEDVASLVSRAVDGGKYGVVHGGRLRGAPADSLQIP